MKKLILILVIVLPILANAQDYRVIDWKTNVLNVQTIAIDTFVFDAEPIDYNDAGAITREIGNYFIDYVARCFKIIDSDANTITVVDLEHINLAPQSNKIGRVYQSIVDADSIFKSIGGVDISVLDDLSRWKDVARNNELFGRKIKELDGRDTTGIYHINRQLLDDITPEDTTRWATGGLVTESDPTVSALVKSIDATDTTYWGRAETDPTVYPWAKAATKPTYTYSEVGAQPAGSYLTSEVDGSTTNEIQDLSRAGNTLSLSGDGTSVDLSDLVNPSLTGYATTTQLADQLSQTITNGVTTKAPSEDAVYDALSLRVPYTGATSNLNLGNQQLLASTIFAGSTYINGSSFEINANGTGNRYAFIDFHGDDTNTDFGLRIIRGNTGVNAGSQFIHLGNGPLSFTSYTGKIEFANGGAIRMNILPTGEVGIGALYPNSKLQVGTATANSNVLARNLILIGGYSTTTERHQNLMTFSGIGEGYISQNPFDDTSAGEDRNWHIGMISDFSYFQVPRFSFINYGVEHVTILNNGRLGVGTNAPLSNIHSLATTTQLRLGYDASKYTDFTTSSSGNLTIAPIGAGVSIIGGLSVSGYSSFSGQVEMTGLDVNLGASTVLRKNGSDVFISPITMGASGSAGQVLTSTGINSAPTWTTPATGSGSGITSIGMQVPTGLTVSPASLTANGTFTIGLQSGYSIPTTTNQTNWSTAYTNRITSAVGTTPLALSISNNTLSGYLSWTLTNINNATPSVGYLYYNGSTYSYQAATTTYTLPTASSSALGGVKVATDDGGLYMSGGFLLQKDNVLTARTPVLSDPIAFYDASATAQGQTTFAEIRTIMNGVQTLTSASSITMNFATAPKASLSLATNGTISITNVPDGGEGSIEVTSSGAYTLAIAGSTGYTSTQKMGTVSAIASSAHTTVFYWRSGTVLYYGFLLNN